MNTIIMSIVILAALGILIGILLGVAGKVFAVETDEKVVQVRECLPGNNCGGCGYPGCDGLAEAIAAGEASIDACPVGGAAVAQKIGKIMGVETEESVKKVAYVRCAGTCEKASSKYNYVGEMSCKDAMMVPGQGEKACSYGCLGLGSCVHTVRNKLESKDCTASQQFTENTDQGKSQCKSQSHSDSVKGRGKYIVFGCIRLCTAKDDTVYNDQRNIYAQRTVKKWNIRL
jgi:RnfABCDGE-type electron transport complex B subunit